MVTKGEDIYVQYALGTRDIKYWCSRYNMQSDGAAVADTNSAVHGAAGSSEKASWITQGACLVCGFCIFLTTFAIIKTIGVFFIQFQMEFGARAAEASFTISLPSTIVFLGGPFQGAIFNLVSIKQAYIITSILMCGGFGACFYAPSLLVVQICFGIAGFGAGLSNVTTLTLMGRAFYTSRPMAMAALAMGGATAGAAVTPIMQWCINQYTWRGALLILGGFCLHGIVFGLAIEPLYNTIIQKRRNTLIARILLDESKKDHLPEKGDEAMIDVKSITTVDTNLESTTDNKATCDKSVNSTTLPLPESAQERRKSSISDLLYALRTNVVSAFDLSLLNDRWFIVYCISCGLGICSRLLSGLYLVRYSQYVGLTDEEAAVKLSICELVGFAVMPVVAVVTSVKKETSQRQEANFVRWLRLIVSSVKSAFILGFFQLMMSVVIATSTAFETNNQMTIYAALLGFCYGGITFMTNAVLADLFGTKRLAGALGYRSLSSGILFLISPPTIGILIDLLGTYVVAQYFTSAMTLLAGMLTIMTQIALLWREKSDNLDMEQS